MQKACPKPNCADLNCGFVYSYKYCYEYQNTKCPRQNCPYLHCTSIEQFRYAVTGKATDNLKREVGRTLQSVNICGDFKKNLCKRAICNRRHICHDVQPLECPICQERIVTKTFGAATCGHIFCYNCALQFISPDEEGINIKCRICGLHVKYKKFI